MKKITVEDAVASGIIGFFIGSFIFPIIGFLWFGSWFIVITMMLSTICGIVTTIIKNRKESNYNE